MYQKNEQGIALLYVLGILALLTVMALAFMNSSIFDQRAMAHSSAGSVAENLALATMEKVIYAIQDATVVKSDEDTVSYMPDDHYQTSGTGTTDKYIPEDQNALKNLDTFDYFGKSKVYVFDWKEFKKENKQDDDIRWILHRVKIGKKGENDIYEVIGRTAFVLHPLGTSQLDPAYLVKYGIDENAEEEARRGQDISEINILNIKKTFGSDSLFKNRASFFNYQDNNGAPTGKLPLSGTWGTTQDLLDAFFIANSGLSTSLTEEIGNFANEFFLCDSGASPREEKYIMNYEDTSGDAQKLELHRFYLPRFDDKKDSAIHPERRNGIYEPAAPNNETNFWDNLDINTKILLNPSTASPYNIGVDLLATDSTVDGIKWKDDALSDSFTADDYAIGRGIQWLANFGYDDEGNLLNDELKGTFGNILHRRQQIAANLKDYCDSDDIPTSDVLPKNWKLTGVDGTDIPTYTGNEKTLYLNEVQTRVNIGATLIPTTAEGVITDITVDGELDIGIEAEAINIYKYKDGKIIPDGKDVKVELQCIISDIEVKLTLGEIVKTFPQDDSTVDIPIILDKLPTPTDGYAYNTEAESVLKVSIDATETGYNDTGKVAPSEGKIEISFKVEIKNAILKYVDSTNPDENIDYCKINKVLTVFKKTLDVTVDGDAEKAYILSTQTEDPRQNLNSGDWTSGADWLELTGIDDDNKNNIGETNANSNPNAAPEGESDFEKATSPAYVGDANTEHISTAYIRNAPMLSPWELGFIHRGKKWQTLNLSKYNKSKAVKGYKNSNNNWFLPGGGKYEDGDANILDQIKMTPEAKSPVKVNLAGKSDEMLNALFAGIYLGCSPIMYGGSIDNISKSGTEITPEFISPIVSKLKAANFTTRAGIADILSEKLKNEGKTTKAEREELIGKVIQLVDIYPSLQMFELIILSQAIKDIGVPTAHDEKITVRKSYYDGSVFKTTKDIDAYIGEINWDKSAGVIADEVLAQRKLRIRGFRKPSGEVQLISIKTLE
ncbi:MAG: hypothetical protein PHT71_02920 [Victivallaceae bacterium]|nr:hypothetical protein [Victivallaceae bacterium]